MEFPMFAVLHDSIGESEVPCESQKAVVQRAQTADQLLGMGFSAEQVFSALLSSQGDRVKALDTLLGAR
ncbi:UBA domain-containing protein [Trichostrongylus colubriformis]|uniref:UBA domain-containing protein n=1 Tax=Trichostrongylus colubriformis TaxID=6319 RepID=A0AAN8IE01_TRICO